MANLQHGQLSIVFFTSSVRSDITPGDTRSDLSRTMPVVGEEGGREGGRKGGISRLFLFSHQAVVL